MYPFPGDEPEQDVILGLLGKSCPCLPSTGVALKQCVAGKALQVKLEDQVACLKQPEHLSIVPKKSAKHKHTKNTCTQK
jgi:hypothetical protein